MKINEATICDGIPAVAWKMLLTNVEVTEILTKLFNIIRSKREFRKEWKTALIQPICTGNGIRRQPGNYKGISLLPVLGNIHSGIRPTYLVMLVSPSAVGTPVTSRSPVLIRVMI